MFFNSLTFFVFFALVFPTYWLAPARYRNVILLVASYVFYGWWDWRFLSLLAFSTLADFNIAQRLHRQQDERRRRTFLFLSLCINLGILGAFKYAGFFVDSFAHALDAIGFQPNRSTLDIVLPVGISFYTFQTISYTFDVYRRRVTPTRNWVTFATYVAYFPQLVAGPIERARHLLPRVENIHREFPRQRQLESGLGLILLGLLRKVVLADGAAAIANAAFADFEDASFATLLVGVLAFSLQIYGDFAGYTDIARGVSRLLGIELVVNFRQPYLSRNITEFWRRWHISLSDWLRDYLYIPLGGNRGGSAATHRNLIITMLLGGLWHGASWNFVIWGGLHGAYLSIHRVARDGLVPERDVTRRDLPAVLLTFSAVTLTWVFFRAATLGDSLSILGRIATGASGGFDPADLVTVVMLFAVSVVVDIVQRRVSGSSLTPSESPVATGLVVGACTIAILVFSSGTPQPFIYFQF